MTSPTGVLGSLFLSFSYDLIPAMKTPRLKPQQSFPLQHRRSVFTPDSGIASDLWWYRRVYVSFALICDLALESLMCFVAYHRAHSETIVDWELMFLPRHSTSIPVAMDTLHNIMKTIYSQEFEMFYSLGSNL